MLIKLRKISKDSRKAFEKATKIFPLSFEITQAMDELNNSERIYKK